MTYRRLGNYEYIPGSGWQRAQGRKLRDFTARSHNRIVLSFPVVGHLWAETGKRFV